MKNKGRLPPLVRLMILTTISASVWVVFGVYRRLNVRPTPEVPPAVLVPLDPSLDSEALELIQRRIHLGEGEIGDTVLLTPSVSAPVPPTPVATQGGEINEQ